MKAGLVRLRIEAVCGVRVERGFRNCSRSVHPAEEIGVRMRERSDKEGTVLVGAVNASLLPVDAELWDGAKGPSETSGSSAKVSGLLA